MPDEDITQISLGRFRVGITGLKAAIEEAKSWRERPEEEIAQALLASGQAQELHSRLRPGGV